MTGLHLSAGKIKHWAEAHFGKGTKPEAVILTHGHFDHVGAVEDLLQDWNVPVYAHPAEFPYLIGHEKYPPPDPGVYTSDWDAARASVEKLAQLHPRTIAPSHGLPMQR